MGYWLTLKGFISKELLQTLRDPRMRMLLFVAPVLQLTIFGVALSNETRNVRLAAQFSPHDEVTRELVTRAFASGWFVAAETTGNDVYSWIQSGQAEAVIIAPAQGLTKSMAHQDGRVQLLINAQNNLRASSIENSILAILHAVVEETRGSGVESKTPFQFDVRAMYNPTFETSIYMVPGVMSMLICLVTVVLTSMSVARERELGTLETLLASPISVTELLLGKTVPFVLLGMIQVPLILTAAIILFNLPVHGPLLMLMGASLFFVLNTVSIGILISTIAKNQQQAMLGGLLFLFPAILLSGLMFPLDNMPAYMRFIAELNPLSHFIGLLRNILLKGGSGLYFAIHCGILASSAAIFLFFGARRFKSNVG